MNESKSYIIISLKHTQRRDKFITLWRPNNCGYCFGLSDCGLYTEIIDGYHDDKYDSMPIEYSNIIDKFGLYAVDYSEKQCLPNCKAVWDFLEVKMTKNGLIRL